MKKMTKQFFVAVMALAAFTACSDANLAEGESGINELNFDIPMYSSVLTDASGQAISNVSADQGTYYLNIKTDGLWYIETADNMEFTPTKMYGEGSARVPVLIGNNWAENRQLSYNVKFLSKDGAFTRAGDGTQTVTQDALTSIERFKKVVNSNVFVGYGYQRTKSPVAELCTGIQIFRMEAMNEIDSLVKHDFAPETKEEYFYHTSDSMMDKLVAVKGNPGGNFGSVKLGLSSDVNVNRVSHTGHTVVQKSLTRSMYSRELAWEKAWFNDANYSEGYKYYKKLFISQFKAAGEDATKKKAAADEFFRIVGTHFITKCLLGCELNYRMTVDSSKVVKSTDVKAALDFKWQQQIKDTTGVDSVTKAKILEQMKDSTKLKNFFFSGNVQVTDAQFNAASSTRAKVKARGNDVQLVNILATGGSLNCTDLAQWMLGAEPEKAAMVGMQVHPIYDIFDGSVAESDEAKAREYLVKYIDKSFSLDESKYGNELTIDLSDLK
ncbi:MAG: hypothetical protein II866_04780 [Prevotella sp.]|nr:hypothetical protein [Prevotella sp.]